MRHALERTIEAKPPTSSLCHHAHTHKVTDETSKSGNLRAYKALPNDDSLAFEFLHQLSGIGYFHPAKAFGSKRIRQTKKTPGDPFEKKLAPRLQHSTHLRQSRRPFRLEMDRSKIKN